MDDRFPGERRSDKGKDKPRMVENSKAVGSEEEESKRKTPALKKNSLKMKIIEDQAHKSTGSDH